MADSKVYTPIGGRSGSGGRGRRGGRGQNPVALNPELRERERERERELQRRWEEKGEKGIESAVDAETATMPSGPSATDVSSPAFSSTPKPPPILNGSPVSATGSALVVASLSKIYPKDMEAPAGGVDDMTKLSYLHEPGVLQNLALRYQTNEIYEDVFQLVGVPLVKNALTGYNTSILAYGQTGSGKTYTMWGSPSAMVDSHLANSHQGIVPRIFQMLFSEIQQEQENSDGKQINYQCWCSFLEIYNEQIGDLLDPTQRNLEIKDDAKHGFYVENLTEEYVTSYDDITQILIKGLSSRKVGATSINSKSSRSHIVFTCVIESWSKGTSSTCFGSSKTSRISLVDLAGLFLHLLC